MHISSRKRELLATLPWEPQCLDAGYGWICVGGSDNGRCAFICIGEDGFDNDRGGDRAFHQHAEVDALLPIDLDPESRLLAHSFLRQGQPSVHSSGHRRPEVQIHDVGGSIINSVTIHRIKGDQKGLEDETVTVLT